MSKLQKTLIQLGVVIFILTLAVGIANVMVSLKKPPEKKPQTVTTPLLNAVAVSQETIQMSILGSGTVRPRMEVQVVPQVSGIVIQCNRQLVNGGFFKANETLLKIEQTDYELAVESAAAVVAQAEVQLEREKAEADVAKKEWDKLRPGEEPDSVLVFRGPQIRSAQAQLKAAKAQLSKAELDLERTTIKMPFDGRVVSTNVDIGQFISAGMSIATVYRTDLVEIVLPLENSELAWFDVPLDGNSDQNSNPNTVADVMYEFAGSEYHRQGQLVRTEGQIDPRSRMVHVVTQVDDPFKTRSGQPPLVPGTFVKVSIQGKKVDSIVRVPRYAMHGKDQVWVAHEISDPMVESSDPDNELAAEEHSAPDDILETEETPWQRCELRIVTVKAIRIDKEYAYVSEGLNDGDVVITSPLETVTDGMQIRVVIEAVDAQEDAL